jgi:hypothetical protein
MLHWWSALFDTTRSRRPGRGVIWRCRAIVARHSTRLSEFLLAVVPTLIPIWQCMGHRHGSLCIWTESSRHRIRCTVWWLTTTGIDIHGWWSLARRHAIGGVALALAFKMA